MPDHLLKCFVRQYHPSAHRIGRQSGKSVRFFFSLYSKTSWKLKVFYSADVLSSSGYETHLITSRHIFIQTDDHLAVCYSGENTIINSLSD